MPRGDCIGAATVWSAVLCLGSIGMVMIICAFVVLDRPPVVQYLLVWFGVVEIICVIKMVTKCRIGCSGFEWSVEGTRDCGCCICARSGSTDPELGLYKKYKTGCYEWYFKCIRSKPVTHIDLNLVNNNV